MKEKLEAQTKLIRLKKSKVNEKKQPQLFLNVQELKFIICKHAFYFSLDYIAVIKTNMKTFRQCKSI